MTVIFSVIVVFLLILAVFDLFVGVSNDAVNFLSSAIGAKAAGLKAVLVIASIGVLVGAMTSAGMMDVARHGVMQPQNFSFYQVMAIFMAVMVANVIILDVFNTLGLPTSTTVSLVFNLLGGTVAIALLERMKGNPHSISEMVNSDQVLTMIIAIFFSVAVAFVFGLIVQWITRLIFTFKVSDHGRWFVPFFGGISMTCLAYFIFVKGLADSPAMSEASKLWVDENTTILMVYIFIGTTVLSGVMQLLHVNVFRVIVLLGTFGLAMAFAGNDLVNFIGVPLAGLDSFETWEASGTPDVHTFMMDSLLGPSTSPWYYLLITGIIMIISMCTSSKAQNVLKTSVDLSRQDDGDEMFGSSRAARHIVRAVRDSTSWMSRLVPKSTAQRIDRRFDRTEAVLPEGAAFDMVRASVNLVLASLLIILGTTFTLPLSTTYVTFMVAMGSSLADRAWSRESAVFRVTGVISVIGGWFITAGVSFIVSGVIALLMYWLSYPAMMISIVIVVVMLVRSQRQYNQKEKAGKTESKFRLMMRTRDPELVWDMLRTHVQQTQVFVAHFALTQFNNICDGLSKESARQLRHVQSDLDEEQSQLKRYRKREYLALRRIPRDIAMERNTWFHLGANSDQQFVYCLKRMLDPVKEHVDNNFNPLPKHYFDDFHPVREKINELFSNAEQMITSGDYKEYHPLLDQADACKNRLSVLRKQFLDQMQNDMDDAEYKAALVYLNLLQESQEFLSIMRHQLRAAHRFLRETR